MPEKLRKPGFIMIWPNELEILKKINPTAFVLLQVYRFNKDRETSISSISDLTIHKLTGFGRNRIARAKLQLIKHSFIEQIGYHQYYIPCNDVYRSCSKTEQPNEKSCSKTEQPVALKQSNSCSKTEQQLLQNGVVTNNIDRKDVVDNKATTLSTILKDELKHLFETQGQQGDALLVFFYTVAQERLSKGHKEGILRIAIKRAISANSKATIQDILSNDSLTAIKSEQDRIKQKAADDLAQAEALKNKAPDHVAGDFIKQMKEAVK